MGRYRDNHMQALHRETGENEGQGEKMLKSSQRGGKKHVFKRSIIRLMADFPKKQWKPKTIKGHI